jgi:hypothetical protein
LAGVNPYFLALKKFIQGKSKHSRIIISYKVNLIVKIMHDFVESVAVAKP